MTDPQNLASKLASQNNDDKSAPELDNLDHVAIQVEDIQSTLRWYTEKFKCTIDYVDESWAYIRFGNIKLALVLAGQHPPHICLTSQDAASFGKLKLHRDGTQSIYVRDPSGNSVEILQE